MEKVHPIVLISPIKSGTHFARDILARITGLNCYEPPIRERRLSYRDPEVLDFPLSSFFSWHLIPEPPVVQCLRAMDAKVICLYRNLYDLLVSIYYHFSLNIDHETGGAAEKDKFINKLLRNEAFWLILTGFNEEVSWIGLTETFHQMRLMLSLSGQVQVLHTSYERLVDQCPNEIRTLARFIGKNLSDDQIGEIAQAVVFDKMKQQAETQGMGTSHFRVGKVGHNRRELSQAQRIALRGLIRATEPSLPGLLHDLGLSEVLRE